MLGGEETSARNTQGADMNFMWYPSHFVPGSASLTNQPMSADSPPPATQIPDLLRPQSEAELESLALFNDIFDRFQSRIEAEGLNKYLSF